MLPMLNNLDSFLRWRAYSDTICRVLLPYLPNKFTTYYEPFLGAGTMLGAIGANNNAIAGDHNEALMLVWKILQDEPESIHVNYAVQLKQAQEDSLAYYHKVRERYNRKHSPYDLIFLSNLCSLEVHNVVFGTDGSFQNGIRTDGARMKTWNMRHAVETYNRRCKDTRFRTGDYCDTLHDVEKGDFVYLDPPKPLEAPRFKYEKFFAELDRLNHIGAKIVCTFDGRMPRMEQTVRIPYEDLNMQLYVIERTNTVGKNNYRLALPDKVRASAIIDYVYTNYTIKGIK